MTTIALSRTAHAGAEQQLMRTLRRQPVLLRLLHIGEQLVALLLCRRGLWRRARRRLPLPHQRCCLYAVHRTDTLVVAPEAGILASPEVRPDGIGDTRVVTFAEPS